MTGCQVGFDRSLNPEILAKERVAFLPACCEQIWAAELQGLIYACLYLLSLSTNQHEISIHFLFRKKKQQRDKKGKSD